MKREKFVIDYPEDADIKRNINNILDQSLQPKKTFIGFLKEMHEQLGWRYIFRDYLELGIISLLFFLYLGIFIFAISEQIDRPTTALYAYLFITSPLLYGSFMVISRLDKKETFETEMACKYNVYQVATYRMLVFGVVSILANTTQIIATSFVFNDFNTIVALMISLTSLFIFALGFLFLTRRSTSKIKQVFIITGWVAINLAVLFLNDAIYEHILTRIPFIVYPVVILICGLLYLKNVKQLTTRKRSDRYASSL